MFKFNHIIQMKLYSKDEKIMKINLKCIQRRFSKRNCCTYLFTYVNTNYIH